MRKHFNRLTVTLWVVGMMAGFAWAQGQGQGRTRSQTQQKTETVGDKVREVLPASEPVFATKDITLIQTWFKTNLSSLPPGLAKRETLPPGLEKQLQKKGTLPPGLQKKIQPLPVALEKQLPPIPTGYRRVVVAGNVILMEPTTGLIYDIVRNVIP